jgi:NADH-quinone oxidoreductase subunit A
MQLILIYSLLFTAVGAGFVFINLLVGKLVRPSKPNPEKLSIYECGEPTVGSAWVQFDLRYYVVALLFVIFDVEVAFFFPWATVYGKLVNLSGDMPAAERVELNRGVDPTFDASANLSDFTIAKNAADNAAAAGTMAWFAFADILVFFGVLLVGYAYLWRRGDLNWVRSVTGSRAQEEQKDPAGLPPHMQQTVLVSGGK